VSHRRNVPSESIEMADELLMEAVHNEQVIETGKVPRLANLEEAEEMMTIERDEQWEHFFMPTIEHQLTNPGSSLTGFSIMQDINAEEYEGAGLLPHTHPVGVLPRRVRQSQVTKLQAVRFHNKCKEEERAAMLRLRARNDATIASLRGKR
jgi:hypothetical protein